MKRSFLPVRKILVATFTGISFASLLVAQPSLADSNQSFGTLDNSALSTQGDRNSFTGTGSDFNMFDLIHRASLGPLDWNPEQQNQQLDDAAATFKARQKKLIPTQPQLNPSSNLNTSGENKPSLLLLPSNQ